MHDIRTSFNMFLCILGVILVRFDVDYIRLSLRCFDAKLVHFCRYLGSKWLPIHRRSLWRTLYDQLNVKRAPKSSQTSPYHGRVVTYHSQPLSRSGRDLSRLGHNRLCFGRKRTQLWWFPWVFIPGPWKLLLFASFGLFSGVSLPGHHGPAERKF